MMLAEKEDNIKIIQESLPALSDSDREIIFFRIYEGWGYSDIAEVLSINEDAARKRFERALWNLELILKKRGIVQEHVS